MQGVEDGAHLLAAERLCGGQREQREEGAQQQRRARAAHGARSVHGSGTATARRKKTKRKRGKEEEEEEAAMKLSSVKVRGGSCVSASDQHPSAPAVSCCRSLPPPPPVQKTSDSLLTRGTRLSGFVARMIWSLYTCMRASRCEGCAWRPPPHPPPTPPRLP